MRVFLIQNVKGLWPSSGEWLANMNLLSYLSSKGHATAQICYATQEEVARYCQQAKKKSWEPSIQKSYARFSQGTEIIKLPVTTFFSIDETFTIVLDQESFQKHYPSSALDEDVAEYLETDKLSLKLHGLVNHLIARIAQFRPTHILFNDPISLKATSTRPGFDDASLVYMIHCAEQLPFGPFSGKLPGSSNSAMELSLLRTVDGIWSVSKAISDYSKQHGQLDTTTLAHQIWTFLDDSHKIPPHLNNWNQDVVGMINPSSFKGINILIGLAKALPQFRFVAWRSWAPEEDDMKEMERIKNIEVRPSTTNMDEIWSILKVLIVPSLWLEAWGLVVTEAQLRGIPVISSNAGGIPEAKLGVPYVIPVKPLTGEQNAQHHYVIKDQNIKPWEEALEKLMTNADEYKRVSNLARQKTVEWLKNVGEDAQEKWLEGLQKSETNGLQEQ